MDEYNRNEQRTRKSQKLVYELIVSRLRSEQVAVIEEAKKYLKMNESEKRSFDARMHCLFELDHALNWFVDRMLCDRRK